MENNLRSSRNQGRVIQQKLYSRLVSYMAMYGRVLFPPQQITFRGEHVQL
jgi:hypothetical protein